MTLKREDHFREHDHKVLENYAERLHILDSLLHYPDAGDWYYYR